MSRVQKRVHNPQVLPLNFTRAPLASELEHLTSDEKIEYLLTADASAAARRMKLWFLINRLTESEKRQIVASYTR